VTRAAVALDIGGSNVRVAVVDAEGRCGRVARLEAPNFLRGEQLDRARLQETLLELVARRVADAVGESDLEEPVCVGISFPGPVDGDGTVLSAPTLWGAGACPFPLGPRLQSELGTPHVFVMNDITAAAHYYAGETTARRFCVVTVSSGIGNKVFDRDHPDGVLLAENGYGGEIGHVTVDDSPEAPLCDCGGRGHLGAIASGRGLERLVRKRAPRESSLRSRSPLLAAAVRDPSAITNEGHVVPAIRAGDPFALECLEEATRPLVQCLATMALGIGIEQFIFIGGLALSIGEPYLETVRRIWSERASYHMWDERPDTFFVLGRRDEEPCLRGAGKVALRRLRGDSLS
jgi:predicted NBD/HSP70 family sugar kinase